MNAEINIPEYARTDANQTATASAAGAAATERTRGPDVTVVMPIFNCAPFLPVQLACLLEHQQVDLEIIAVDDGSRDGSLRLLQEYAAKDPRLKVISQSNSGPGVARNAALRLARGEWIVFADADDRMSPNGLIEWLAQARREKLDLLIGNGYRFTYDIEISGRPMLKRQPWGQVLSGTAWIEHCVKEREWPHYSPLQMFRRELLTQHHLAFVGGVLHEDVLWTTDLALAAKRVGFNASPLYGYRRNPNSIVNSTSPAYLMMRGCGYVAIIDMLLERASCPSYPPSLRNAFIQHAHTEMRYFSDLVRKSIQNAHARRTLCHAMAEVHPWKPLLRSVSSYGQLRRLVRAYWTILSGGGLRSWARTGKRDATRSGYYR